MALKNREFSVDLSISEAELVIRALRRDALTTRRDSLERRAISAIIYKLEKKIETTPIKHVKVASVEVVDDG